MKNQWVVTPKPLPDAEVKLLCFPYAGGGVSIYHPWHRQLNNHVELNIVQLPGRGTHFSQSPIDDMDTLVAALLPKLSGLLQHNYVVYGHSLGSRVAFELVRQAMAKGFPPPLHFFASGSASPKAKRSENTIYQLPDEGFIQALKDMNGTPPEILQNRQMMDLFMPTLRADFKLAEDYFCHKSFTIPTDVTVLSGRDDRVSTEQLQRWGDFFKSSQIVMCDGDHFFIDSHPQQVLDVVNAKLAEKVAVAA